MLNFKSNLGTCTRTYGHDLMAYERDARGANVHADEFNLHPGAKCAHAHGFK